MRATVSSDRFGWFYSLDHRKIIIIAFLSRFIFASIYDIFIAMGGDDVLLPDAKFYSVRGRYIALLLNRYDKGFLAKDFVPSDRESQQIFLNTLAKEKGRFLPYQSEGNLFSYIIGMIYFIFGYFPLGVRAFNITLSIGSTYCLFKIAKRHFGDLTANLFLLVALFLPSQFGYSITMSRDFIRMFIVSLILWVIYG